MSRSNPPEIRRRTRALRVTVPALAVVLASTGCVKQKDPGLKVANLESSIVFGLKPLPVVAPPGAAAPLFTPTAEPVAGAPEAPLPQIPTLPPPQPPPKVVLRGKQTYFCRSATINDFAKTAAIDAPNPPKAGIYQFKATPPLNLASDHYNLGPTDLQSRVITNVTEPTRTTNQVNSAPAPVGNGAPVTQSVYQYDQFTFLDPAGKQVLVDRIQVTDNGPVQAVGTSVGPVEYVGGSDRGVALVGRQVVSNGQTGTFIPTTPLLLLPLPAVSGQTWQSVATDPVSGATYILYGRIVNRQTVDACGDVVEGWAVEAQTVFQDPRASGPQNATFRYFVDTNNGGQIVYEKTDPLSAPPNPVNGTPVDAAIPASPDLPSTAIAAPASEMSLARKTPEPLSK